MKKNLEAIQVIRGFAALFVLLYHASALIAYRLNYNLVPYFWSRVLVRTINKCPWKIHFIEDFYVAWIFLWVGDEPMWAYTDCCMRMVSGHVTHWMHLPKVEIDHSEL